MKIVKRENAKIIKNSDTSWLLEYSIDLADKDIDFAINHISGRYLESGFCTNQECKELVYVLDGFGTLNKNNCSISFSKGDVLLIDKKEIYFWEGKCQVIMICIPTWYREQCKLFKEEDVNSCG